MLSRRSGRVEVRVDGIAASGASIIAMSAYEVVMPRGAWLMIHPAHGKMEGGVEDFRDAAEELERVNASIFPFYRPRWLGTDAELRIALSTDTWFDAHQAAAAGLADRIGDSLQTAASVDQLRA
jgi:ATP-dependent protease ClpP protease subunit